MDSLLGYVSDDDSEEAGLPQPAATIARVEASPNLQSVGQGILGKLPAPKDPHFSMLRSSPVISRNSAVKGSKRIVTFQVPLPKTGEQNEEKEDVPKKKVKLSSGPVAGKTGLAAFLPAPKYTRRTLGEGSSAQTSRKAAFSVSNTDENHELVEEQIQKNSDPVANTIEVQQVAHDLHSAVQGFPDQEGVGLYPSQESAVSMPEQYPYVQGDYFQTADYGSSLNYPEQGVELVNQYSGYDPSLQQPVEDEDPLEKVVAAERRRGGKEFRAIEIKEVRQQDLTKGGGYKPVEPKLTGLAFGPAYEPSSSKEKPSKMHRRKHQIGSLYLDMKKNESSLAERRSRGMLTKAETHAKYGW